MYHYETSNRDGAEREEEGGERGGREGEGVFLGILGKVEDSGYANDIGSSGGTRYRCL